MQTLLTWAPLEHDRWMRVEYDSFWPSDMQAEPSVNSSNSRSRSLMMGPRLAIPMLLIDTTSFRVSWKEHKADRNKLELFTDTSAAFLQAVNEWSYFSFLAHLLIFHLTDRCMAVAAQNRVHWPTYVEVILLRVEGVRIIHDLPVAGRCGVRQAGSRRR